MALPASPVWANYTAESYANDPDLVGGASTELFDLMYNEIFERWTQNEVGFVLAQPFCDRTFGLLLQQIFVELLFAAQ